MPGEKETYKYLEYWKRTPSNELLRRKKKSFEKSISEERERLLETKQKSHQWDGQLDCPPCMIPGTILEMDEGRTSINGSENKKTNNDA